MVTKFSRIYLYLLLHKGEGVDFTNFLYHRIGERIKDYRRTKFGKQKDFLAYIQLEHHSYAMDRQRLSYIENGKTSKKKNPHFLSESHVELFSKIIDISSKELKFGNLAEQEEFMKLVLINIFMNGSTQMPDTRMEQVEFNPIFDVLESDKEFFRLAMHNLKMYLEDEKALYRIATDNFYIASGGDIVNHTKVLEDRKNISSKLSSIDNFFFGKYSAKYYRLLMDGSQMYAEQAAILLKCLLGNFNLASDFLARCDNLETYGFGGLELRSPDLDVYYIDNYLGGKGNFSAAVIDWKEISYRKFIAAFNEFYKIHSVKFYNFFDEHIFSKTLKELSNQYINNLFSSLTFINLLKDIFEEDQFIPSRMIGHNFTRVEIQKSFLIKQNSEMVLKDGISLPAKTMFEDCYDLTKDTTNHKEYNLTKYLYDVENMTYMFAHSNDENPPRSTGLHLPAYFEVESLK